MLLTGIPHTINSLIWRFFSPITNNHTRRSCGVYFLQCLTHWGRVTHICVGNLTIVDSDYGLSPDRHQAIIWTKAGLLLIGPFGTNVSEIFVEIITFSFKKMRWNVSYAKWRPFCLGLNVLITTYSRLCHADIYIYIYWKYWTFSL